MTKWLPLLCLLAATNAVAAPIWTWVDENGQQHFSDRPVPGATQIEVADAQAFSLPTPPPRPPVNQQASTANTDDDSQPAQAYTNFAVLRPTDQETLWNLEGNLQVQVALEPLLQNGHRLNVYLDGVLKRIGAMSSTFIVPEVYRGEHKFAVALTDAEGNELMRTAEITFFVHQTTVLRPGR